MSWDNGRQHSHCMLTMGFLIALLGEFPASALDSVGNKYLLNSCVKLHTPFLEVVNSCGIATLPNQQRNVVDENTVAVFNTAIQKSRERGYLDTSKKKLDLYSWLLSWQCGYWAFLDCITSCSGIVFKKAIVWKTLKFCMNNIDSYMESYENAYQNLQDDGWWLYEFFLKESGQKRFKKGRI